MLTDQQIAAARRAHHRDQFDGHWETAWEAFMGHMSNETRACLEMEEFAALKAAHQAGFQGGMRAGYALAMRDLEKLREGRT